MGGAGRLSQKPSVLVKTGDVLQVLILGGRQIQNEKYIEPPYTSTPYNK